MTTCDRCGGETEVRRARVRWPVRLALWGITFLLAWAWVAPGLNGVFEGVRSGWRPAVPALAATAVLALAAFLAGFARVRRPACVSCGETMPAWLFAPALPRTDAAHALAGAHGEANDAEALAGTDRRGFLQTAGAVGASGLATAVAGLGGVAVRQHRWRDVGRDVFFADVEKVAPVQRPEWAGSTVKSYRRLGRTGAMVSDISLGSGRIDDPRVALLALERGINYFDTAPDYSRNGSEILLGKAIREHGARDKMFLASKFCTAEGHLPADAPVAEIVRAVEGSLQRLQTDWLDLVHIHSCDTEERLMAPTFHEAFDRLKEQGKVRFLGFSSHTPNLEAVAERALASGRFDVMMLAYHHGLFPGISEIVERAHRQDVGVVAMKTLKGAKAENLPGLREQSTAYSQAAFRWVLENPAVSCLVVSFFKPEQCDEYLFASGTKPDDADRALLERYDRLASADYCRPHCGACLDRCPSALPIDTVLRYDMYFADYGREAAAREKYARLGTSRDASACLGCPAPCAGSCPYELPIRAKMVRAHERLRA
jgi:predicted aldo/keto reductase-like oxidoreductase